MDKTSPASIVFVLAGLTTGFVAIVLGIQGRSHAKDTGLGGGGLAVLGIILGLLSVGFVLLHLFALAQMRR